MLNLTPYDLSVDTLDVHAVSLEKNHGMHLSGFIQGKRQKLHA